MQSSGHFNTFDSRFTVEGGSGGSTCHPAVARVHVPLTQPPYAESPNSTAHRMAGLYNLQQMPNDHHDMSTALHYSRPSLAAIQSDPRELSHYQQDELKKLHTREDRGGYSRYFLSSGAVSDSGELYDQPPRSLMGLSDEMGWNLPSHVPHVPSTTSPVYPDTHDFYPDGMHSTELSREQAHPAAPRLRALHRSGGYANAGMPPGAALDSVPVQARKSAAFSRGRGSATRSSRAAPRDTALVPVRARLAAAGMVHSMGQQSDLLRLSHQAARREQLEAQRLRAELAEGRERERALEARLRAAEEQLAATRPAPPPVSDESPTESLVEGMLADMWRRSGFPRPECAAPVQAQHQPSQHQTPQLRASQPPRPASAAPTTTPRRPGSASARRGSVAPVSATPRPHTARGASAVGSPPGSSATSRPGSRALSASSSRSGFVRPGSSSASAAPSPRVASRRPSSASASARAPAALRSPVPARAAAMQSIAEEAREPASPQAGRMVGPGGAKLPSIAVVRAGALIQGNWDAFSAVANDTPR
jgi:hypothetical protein